MKKYIGIIKAIVFVFLLIIIFNEVNTILVDKNGVGRVDEFYQLEEDTVDVIFYGASHAHTSFLPSFFWNKSGITSYCLSASTQNAWETYYFMKESLKTQKPKIMVYEVIGLMYGEEYGNFLEENTLQLKMSKNKIDLINTSIPSADRKNFFLKFPLFHDRIKKLSKKDFIYSADIKNANTKGYKVLSSIMPGLEEPSTVLDITESEMSSKSEEYLYKIIQLAKDNNIPLLLVSTPWCVDEIGQKSTNRAKEIAQEKAVPFIDYNYSLDEIGFDFAKHMHETVHENIEGAEITSKALLNYIDENYDLPDHRSEKKYVSWEENAQIASFQMENFKLNYNQDMESILDEINKERYIVAISSSRGAVVQSDSTIIEKLSALGLSKQLLTLEGQWIYSAVIDNNKVVYENAGVEGDINSHQLAIDDTLININTTMWNSELMVENPDISSDSVSSNSTIDIIVYDKITKQSVINISLSPKGTGYNNITEKDLK